MIRQVSDSLKRSWPAVFVPKGFPSVIDARPDPHALIFCDGAKEQQHAGQAAHLHSVGYARPSLSKLY